MLSLSLQKEHFESLELRILAKTHKCNILKKRVGETEAVTQTTGRQTGKQTGRQTDR